MDAWVVKAVRAESFDFAQDRSVAARTDTVLVEVRLGVVSSFLPWVQ